ncbi:hypothetical protein MLD38_025892 [Melastoma candidum]|uniref:Uncharacterized protein n=1 Tax=Melastoma candidum TaxID=119954 RepID=A0ACB9NY78_9MYRT|nr:hypothetical protein MLD38_025892 [Melastoma candidum]
MSEQTPHHHQQQPDLPHLLGIFDSFWSQLPIFSTRPPPLTIPHDTNLQLVTETSRTGLHVRSMSETDLATPSASHVSPDSVHSVTPKLETVVSGKEAAGPFRDGGFKGGKEMDRPGSRKRTKAGKKRRGIARTSSRSLSELEFEELKGFMDLGFVFSERDRDSADLVSIIPGLQRLGMAGEARTTESATSEEVSRPYLSEAWGASEGQRKALPGTRWRIPEIGNKDERVMKDQLKFWAQAVASAVR